MNHIAANAAQNQDGAMQIRPEGAFTGRIHALADNAESVRHSLQRLLNHLRAAPPSIVDGQPATSRQTCIEDYLQHTESANKSISDLLNELEGLFQ